MKLDKIKFARLIGYIQRQFAITITINANELAELDEIIDIDMPEQVAEQVYPKNENVERLMMLMVEGTRKIEAIKEHRTITGMGLKDSKDAVERYWPEKVKTAAELYADMYAELGEDEIIPFDIVKEFLDRFVSRAS